MTDGPIALSKPRDLNELASALAIVAEHSGLDAALIVVADNAGHVEYRSRLGYDDLNRLLRRIGDPLNESLERPL